MCRKSPQNGKVRMGDANLVWVNFHELNIWRSSYVINKPWRIRSEVALRRLIITQVIARLFLTRKIISRLHFRS